jgi:hypothetical protein
VINDPTGLWAKKVHTEAIVAMPGGLFWLIKRLYAVPSLCGMIGRLSYKNRQLTLWYGNFRRDNPKGPVIAHL